MGPKYRIMYNQQPRVYFSKVKSRFRFNDYRDIRVDP